MWFKWNNCSDFTIYYSYQYTFRHDSNPLQWRSINLDKQSLVKPYGNEVSVSKTCHILIYGLKCIDLVRNEKDRKVEKNVCLSWDEIACFLVVFFFVIFNLSCRWKFAYCPSRILKCYRLILQKPPILKW